MPKRGRNRKKTRTHVVQDDSNVGGVSALTSAESLKVPRSLVVRRGRTEPEVVELVSDIRKLMSPHTALNFKEDARNRKATLSHYAKELTSPLGITHLLALSQNSSNLNMRIARTPSGPTLTFKINQFSLSKQIRSVQRRPFQHDNKSASSTFLKAPIVVTNNFGDAKDAAPHLKLMRITFQNMFPAINVATVKLNDCRRVVLFNLVNNVDKAKKAEDGDVVKNKKEGGSDTLATNNTFEEVEVRHYAIRATPVGIDRKVRRLVQAKIPNLSKLNDISDYIMGQTSSGNVAPSATPTNGGGAAMSDSEPEDETSQVILPQKYSGKGNIKSQKSGLKLVELGPRLRLHLLKVERGLANGDVMYHSYVTKSTTEIISQKNRIVEEALLKKRRRDEQDDNVKRKNRAQEEKRERKKSKRLEREKEVMDTLRGGHKKEEEDGTESGKDEASDDESNSDDQD